MAKGRKQFAILGLGRFGASVAKTLTEMGYQALGVDLNASKVQKLSEVLTHVVTADAADEKTLKALGIGNFDVAIISIGNLGASMMCTMLCKDLGIPEVVVKAIDEQHGKMLDKIGADKVIYSEKDMGKRVAHNLVSSHIMDYIELSNDISLMSILVPQDLVGKNLIEANMRQIYKVNIVAIKNAHTTKVNPAPTEILNEGDEIIVIGEHAAVAKLENIVPK